MPNGGNKSAEELRLLIQQVQTGSGQWWRLIAYGDGERHCAPEFATLEALVTLVRRHVPDLDAANIAVPADGLGSSILYAADVVLTNEQRTALGLLTVSNGKSGASR